MFFKGSTSALHKHKDTKSQDYIVWIKPAGIKTKDYVQKGIWAAQYSLAGYFIPCPSGSSRVTVTVLALQIYS